MQSVRSITIRLNTFTQAKYLNDCILHEKKNGNNSIVVKVQDSFSGSNVCAPIAGIIDYHRNSGMKIHVDCPANSYANHVHIYNPILAESIISDVSPFDKVYSFSSEADVESIVNQYTSALREGAELESGIIQSMEWCMNEAIDNVLQHSLSDRGFVMAQLHKQNKSFSFCVFDTGIGIFNSLRKSKHSPRTPLFAIKLAMQERVTRDENVGQGNGLWGLSRIIKETNGHLLISSGGASYNFDNGTETMISSGGFNLGHENGTTMVDFQIDYSVPIDIARALNGYEPIDLWIEQHEERGGEIYFDVALEANGTGTRKSAEKLRNAVINTLTSQHTAITLDFQNVGIISSSFADELIGKLIAILGFSKFMQFIVISNLNDFNEAIVNRSVGQRMAQIFMNEKIDEEGDTP